MSIRRRIQWITIGSLIAIFVVYNILIVLFFIKISTNGEIKQLWNRAQIVLRDPDVHVPANWQKKGLLDEFLVDSSMVRIIDPNGNVRAEAFNDRQLTAMKPVYRTSYHTAIENSGGQRKLYIQVPFFYNKQQAGILELGKTMNIMRDYLGILLTILAFSTLTAAAFSVAAGYSYTRFVFRPISKLAGTMEMIETSGTFRKIENGSVSPDDEIGRLGLTFNRMIAKLEENYNRQKRFAEDASHELRTPLTIIESYAGMLKRWGSENTELRKEAVDAILQEASRLKDLVNRLLLDASDKKRNRRKRQSFDLSQLLRQTASELTRSFGRSIHVEIGEGPIHLTGDREAIKQLLIILLDNSLKYSVKPIRIEAEEEDDSVTLRVIDEGVGIEERHMNYLFDRFYRADHTRNRQTGGSGLGLSIAKRIVEDHAGIIRIASQTGKGTTVTVELPK